MKIRKFSLVGTLMVAALCAVMMGCFGSQDRSSGRNGSEGGSQVKLEFPEGDPSVSAEDGGPGFTGEGWTTADPRALGDERAIKGGTLRTYIASWPDNLRMYGLRANTALNYTIRELCYQSLCQRDKNTLETIPELASHWKISDDVMKFTFRINPRAHWSDGRPITADDVIATYRLIADETLQDPMGRASLVKKMHEPVAISKYIFEVECKEKDWKNFNTIAVEMPILPAHEISTISGNEYLDKYNFRYTAVSGPYIIHEKDIKTDKSLTLTRRTDYWAIDDPMNSGRYNIDKIRYDVIRESRIAYDMACKGELDFYNVNTAKWWVEDLPKLEAVQKGHVVRRKVFTRYPRGIQGYVINLRKPPLDDVRVRKALGHLYDRKTMVEKFAYNEYDLLKSYYPATDAENPENQLIDFDPRKAADLLKQAGWQKRGPDGILVKDGKRLSVTLVYSAKFFEKYLTNFQQAAKQAGFELKLKQLDSTASWNNKQDRKFEIASAGWVPDMFPDPRTLFHSNLAESKGANNFAGFKSPRVDELIEQYDAEFNLAKRTELLRQIDAEVMAQHPYILEWTLGCERFMYWNKFGMPETILPKYSRYDEAFSTWWVDPSKQQALEAARRDGTSLEIFPIEVRPWDGKAESTAGL